jgi:hypothetical protein
MKTEMENLATQENLIKILESGIMIDQFYKELKSNPDVNRAIWYSLRDYHTNLALIQSKGGQDFNPFRDHEKGV